MVDYALFEYIPFPCSQTSPSGSAAEFDVVEILFDKELTEDEQEAVNANVPEENPIDWRDDQTLWVWDSQKELDRWLAHLTSSWQLV